MRINSEVRRSRSYDRRVETPPGGKPWRILNWANDSKDWYQHYYSKRGSASLAADEIGVYGISRNRLERLLSDLDIHLLYYGSYEARSRGELDLKGIGLPPAIREIRDSGEPVDVELGEALRWKALES